MGRKKRGPRDCVSFFLPSLRLIPPLPSSVVRGIQPTVNCTFSRTRVRRADALRANQ